MSVSMTEMDADFIMLSFALTECGRALSNFAEIYELADVRDMVQPGLEGRENARIFDRIRLGLQMTSNVSRLFWPPQNKIRGAHLRDLTGLSNSHGLSDRTLRNHIEHIDERLDIWTAISPRPFLTIEIVIHDDYPSSGPMRDAVNEATPIIYDTKSKTVQIFGDTFSIPELQNNLEDVMDHISHGLQTITSSWPVIEIE